MRFAFTEDQRLFRDSLRDVLTKECTPDQVRASWAEGDGRSRARWGKLAELGVVGITVPEANGGLGLDELSLVLLLEECGRAALPEPIVETTAVVAPMLRDLGARERMQRSIAYGEILATVGLEGVPFVTDAHVADVLVL